MSSDKQGEAQVIEFFSKHLSRKLDQRLGEGNHYTFGNFSGSQDRRFGDVFCGTKSRNILIEFKEFRTERRAESKKPLRQMLCVKLTKSLSKLSRDCHFIGWDKKEVVMNLEFSPYIDTVCPLFTFLVPKGNLKKEQFTGHRDFSAKFVDGDIGVNYKQFSEYVKELDKIAGGSVGGSGEDVEFSSFLYSLDEHGDVKGTKFNSLRELAKVRDLICQHEQELAQKKNKRSNSSGLGFG